MERETKQFVTAEPEEAQALMEHGFITTNPQQAEDFVVLEPFSLDDIKASLLLMRHPDVI